MNKISIIMQKDIDGSPRCCENSDYKVNTSLLYSEVNHCPKPKRKHHTSTAQKKNDYSHIAHNEEIIYEYEEDDVESENKVFSIFLSKEGSEVESTTDVPLLANESRPSEDNEISFYNLRAPHRNEFCSKSFIKNPKIGKICNNFKKNNKVKVLKGDILKHSLRRDKSKSIDFNFLPNRQWVKSDDCKLTLKKLEDTTPDISQSESFLLLSDLNLDSQSESLMINNVKHDEVSFVDRNYKALNSHSKERISNEMILNPIKSSYHEVSMHKHSYSAFDAKSKSICEKCKCIPFSTNSTHHTDNARVRRLEELVKSLNQQNMELRNTINFLVQMKL